MDLKSQSASFPFLGILTLIFITLKLCNVIQWSWWLVLSPIWGAFAFVMAVIIAGLIVVILKD